MTLEDSITLVQEISTKENDDDEEEVGEYLYGAFEEVKVNVILNETKIGSISGTSVDRQKVPDNVFWECFDEHSGKMEWVAGSLLEKKLGRPKLLSLLEAGDDAEFNFFLMESFVIDKTQSLDVATAALRKFLHGDHIKGNFNYGCWGVSSIAYVLNYNPEEISGSKRKRGDDEKVDWYFRESIPFLRNGFFQDEALVRKDSDNARILVAGTAHMEQGLKSESAAMAVAKTLFRERGRTPTGKDAEILRLVESRVNASDQSSMAQQHHSVSSAMLGIVRYNPPGDCTTEEQLKSLRRDLIRLQSVGGSIARSTAVHVACSKNKTAVIKLLLELDSASISATDSMGRTPLIVAALNACGRLSINGIDDTEAIDALLASGANKASTDCMNMTAYGYYRQSSERGARMTYVEKRSTITDLEHKLYPPGGPTASDFTQGKGGSSGFVDYSIDDRGDSDGDY